jgi:hypothetical protein
VCLRPLERGIVKSPPPSKTIVVALSLCPSPPPPFIDRG